MIFLSKPSHQLLVGCAYAAGTAIALRLMTRIAQTRLSRLHEAVLSASMRHRMVSRFVRLVRYLPGTSAGATQTIETTCRAIGRRGVFDRRKCVWHGPIIHICQQCVLILHLLI